MAQWRVVKACRDFGVSAPHLFGALAGTVSEVEEKTRAHLERGRNFDVGNRAYRQRMAAAVHEARGFLEGEGYEFERRKGWKEGHPFADRSKFNVHLDKSALTEVMERECVSAGQVLQFFERNREELDTNDYAFVFELLLKFCDGQSLEEATVEKERIKKTREFRMLLHDVNAWGTSDQYWRYRQWLRGLGQDEDEPRRGPSQTAGFRTDVFPEREWGKRTKVNFYHRPLAAARIFQALSEFGYEDISPGSLGEAVRGLRAYLAKPGAKPVPHPRTVTLLCSTLLNHPEMYWRRDFLALMSSSLKKIAPKHENDLRLHKYLHLPDKVNLCWIMNLHTSTSNAPEVYSAISTLWDHICDADWASAGGLRLDAGHDHETMRKLYELDTVARLNLEDKKVDQFRVKMPTLTPETRLKCEAAVVGEARGKEKWNNRGEEDDMAEMTREIAEELRKMGTDPVVDCKFDEKGLPAGFGSGSPLTCEGSSFNPSIAIIADDRIAIEYRRKSDFWWPNKPGNKHTYDSVLLKPHARYKTFLLQQMGWRTVDVPWNGWRNVTGEEQGKEARTEYLKKKLRGAGLDIDDTFLTSLWR